MHPSPNKTVIVTSKYLYIARDLERGVPRPIRITPNHCAVLAQITPRGECVPESLTVPPMLTPIHLVGVTFLSNSTFSIWHGSRPDDPLTGS